MLRRNWRITAVIIIALIASTVALAEYRRINVLEDRLGCAATWLEKAQSLHAVQMEDPSTFSAGTMRQLMDSVDSAYVCATRDPVAGHVTQVGKRAGRMGGPDAARSFGQYGVLPQR